MFRHYHDILSRISEEPTWWQEGGIPRYGPFDPKESTGIHCNEVVLIEIACQHCDRRFLVTVERDEIDRKLAQEIVDGEMGWGDPPNVQCCGAGPVDTSVPIRVVEYWARGHREYLRPTTTPGVSSITDPEAFSEWRRDPSLEVALPADWHPHHGA